MNDLKLGSMRVWTMLVTTTQQFEVIVTVEKILHYTVNLN